MNPSLRIPEDWTAYQDYLWFLALFAWGGVLAAELGCRYSGRALGGRGWRIAFAASALASTLLELLLASQSLQMHFTKLDLAIGVAQAAGAWSLVWGATEGQLLRTRWRIGAGASLLSLAGARQVLPIEAGLAVALIQFGAVLRLVTMSPRLVSRTAATLLASMPFISVHGPLEHAVREGLGMAYSSHFEQLAAGVSLAAGVVLVLVDWRRRVLLAPVGGVSSPDLRRDLSLALIALALWLAGGILLAEWNARSARQAFEQNLLLRMDAAVLGLEQRTLADALGPDLRIDSIEQRHNPAGRPVSVATVPRHLEPVYAALRTQLSRIKQKNRDFQSLYIAALRPGQLLLLDSQPDKGITSFRYPVGPLVDLDSMSEGWSFFDRQVIGDRGLIPLSAKAALLHPQTSEQLGWLVADVDATHWMTVVRQARLQTMDLIGAGVCLCVMAVAYRLRREALDLAEQRAAAAAEADRRKSVFLATVSHELRTPIQGVLGFSELLESALQSEASRGWLAALRSHGDIMLRLVNDLSQLSVLQSGTLRLESRPIGLRSLVEECAAGLRPAASAKGLLFRTELSPDLPIWVRSDDVRLRQILLNLLNNAVKFTSAGCLVFLVRPHSCGQIEFVVADTGPGIPPALRQRLFQPFARLAPGAGEGSGLGLALVHGLCSAMGGTVHLVEGSCGGATFVVRLPLPLSDAPVTAVSGVEPLLAPNLAGLRVLVVEDNTIVRKLLETFLTGIGADVIVAFDGPTALSLARDGVADVMLLDIGLPQMDGLAVTATLRAEGMRALRIIGLSAHVSAADEARALRAGMDAVLSKPLRLAILAAAIANQGCDSQRAGGDSEHIADSALRLKLMTQFAAETPALLAGMRTALAAGDWACLRSRVHYLKNSADVLGLRALQDGCARILKLDQTPDAGAAQRALEEIEAAIPYHLLASSDHTSAAKAQAWNPPGRPRPAFSSNVNLRSYGEKEEVGKKPK